VTTSKAQELVNEYGFLVIATPDAAMFAKALLLKYVPGRLVHTKTGVHEDDRLAVVGIASEDEWRRQYRSIHGQDPVLEEEYYLRVVGE
jgi:hypothetical protein